MLAATLLGCGSDGPNLDKIGEQYARAKALKDVYARHQSRSLAGGPTGTEHPTLSSYCGEYQGKAPDRACTVFVYTDPNSAGQANIEIGTEKVTVIMDKGGHISGSHVDDSTLP